MYFESDYTGKEIEKILCEKTKKYTYCNLSLSNTVLARFGKNSFSLWKTKCSDSISITKLTNTFYGKILSKNGKTLIKGHFRLSNYDLLSWVTAFMFCLFTVFAASAGALWQRLLNAGIMSIVWCAVCSLTVLLQNLSDHSQKRDVIAFINENLLKKESITSNEKYQ